MGYFRRGKNFGMRQGRYAKVCSIARKMVSVRSVSLLRRAGWFLITVRGRDINYTGALSIEHATY